MRTLALVGLVLGLLVVTAAASPWVTSALVAAVGRPFTFARVYDRVFEVLLVAGLTLAWRPLDLGGPRDVGLGRAGWAADLVTGIGIGVLGIAAALAFSAYFGALAPALRFPAAKTARKVILGLLAAVLIGVGEETLFRGVLLRRVTLDAGRVAGIVITTVIYAAVHAIHRGGHDVALGGWAGVEHTAALFAPLAEPVALPALVGLALLGLLLAAARLRTGSLWVSIGIHATWVATFRVGRLFFDVRPRPTWVVGPAWPPLVGGAAGWVGIALAGAALVAYGRRRSAGSAR